MEHHPGERPTYARDFTMVEVRALRKRTETAVEALLALLDELDEPDFDCEPDNDDLGDYSWPEGCRAFSGPRDEDAEDSADDEPLMGWSERCAGKGGCPTPSDIDECEPDPDKERCALERHGKGFIATGHDDAEEGHDAEWDMSDYEPDADSEPAHGWHSDERGSFIGSAVV